MNPIENIHFTLLIKLNERLHEFNFRKRRDNSYDVDTSDSRGSRHYFKILANGNGWSMMGVNLPKWLTENDTLVLRSLKDKVN